MKNTSLMFGLVVGGISTAGCVVKTSSTSDPASPTTETAPASSPAAPAPASNPAPAQASAPASTPAPASAPAPSPTASPATPPPSRPPVASPASSKTTPALAAKEARPAQPAFTPPPKPKAKPAERKADEAIGAPPNMHPGSLAYWIWRDEKGNGWHLRTTATSSAPHRFSGRVWVDGTFSGLKPSTLELDDRMKNEDAGVIVFDFVTGGGIDGFDFQLAAGRCVTFHLLVDGKPAPKEVEIGRKEVPSGSPTFRLCR